MTATSGTSDGQNHRRLTDGSPLYYKYICKAAGTIKCTFICTGATPINYKYIYNLKYMKICARYKLKLFQLTYQSSLQAMLSSWATVTSTGPHYKLDLRVHAGSMPNKCTFKCTGGCTSCGTGGMWGRAGWAYWPFKCTGSNPLYVHIYVRDDVRPGSVRSVGYCTAFHIM